MVLSHRRKNCTVKKTWWFGLVKYSLMGSFLSFSLLYLVLYLWNVEPHFQWLYILILIFLMFLLWYAILYDKKKSPWNHVFCLLSLYISRHASVISWLSFKNGVFILLLMISLLMVLFDFCRSQEHKKNYLKAYCMWFQFACYFKETIKSQVHFMWSHDL